MMSSSIHARRTSLAVAAVLAVIGLALIAVGIIYFTVRAGQLPTFFPGRAAGHTYHHTKRGIAALGLGVLVLIVAGLSAARKSSAHS